MTRAVNISRIAGFTLIELLVTLAIAAILATIAAPMLSSFLARSQMNAVVNDYTGALQMARMEAVSRNHCVAVCRRATSGAAQCAGEDGPWTSGWLVYENPSCALSSAATDPPSGAALRSREAVPASISLNGMTSDAPDVVVFTPRGFVGQIAMARKIQFTDTRFADGSNNRWVVLSPYGRLIPTSKDGT